MRELIAERISLRRKLLGYSQVTLGGLIGVSQASIQRLESGETQHARNVLRLAAALQTTPEYLTGETDDPASERLSESRLPYGGPPTEHGDTVEVAVSDVTYGMGGAFVDDGASETTIERFPRSFIRQFTKGPVAGLYFATGIGDSMQPTIHHNDLVLIDRSKNALRVSDQLWALSAGAIAMIKRVRVMPDGSVLLVSDNADVSDYPVGEDELHLIGRVVAVVKRL